MPAAAGQGVPRGGGKGQTKRDLANWGVQADAKDDNMGVRRIMGLVGVVTLALMLLAMVITGQRWASAQIYTVREVHAGLQRHPDLWIGRTILVRGGIARQMSYPQCASSTTPLDACPRISYLSFLARLDPTTFHYATVVRGDRRFFTVTYPDVGLWVRLAPGMTALPLTPTPLPSPLYALPLIGPTLAARFPRDGETVLRIHLASAHGCVTTQSTPSGTRPCLDGVVQN
jgi:hypothetical protein